LRFTPSVAAFTNTIASSTQQVNSIAATAPVHNLAAAEPELDGEVYRFMQAHHSFVESTNFNEREILDLYMRSMPFFARFRRRGPGPAINDLDAVLLYLYWAKHGQDYALIAKTFGFGQVAVTTAITRVRDPLLLALQDQFWTNRRRPVPISESHFPYIALAVDSTSIEVNRPVGRFEDAKAYWDGKNHIYALKKEVAVTAAPPHYALYSQTGTVGSVHDYTTFKSTYGSYLSYLTKTPSEVRAIPLDTAAPTWGIVADNGYAGDAADTPGLRKIALVRPSNPLTIQEQQNRVELANMRSCVERFFGRLKRLWGVVRNVYRYAHLSPRRQRRLPSPWGKARLGGGVKGQSPLHKKWTFFRTISHIFSVFVCRWDHSHFDADFDLCVLLTNLHINHMALDTADKEFLERADFTRTQRREEATAKRQNQYRSYQIRKRARLDRL
jgi:hypothetical protein